MLVINENYVPIDEELDIQKQGGGDSYRLWITGTQPELDFLYRNFVVPHLGADKVSWFNAKYNINPPKDATGKAFFAPPLNSIKKSDGSWGYFFWKSKTPEFIEAQLRAIQLFIRDVNIALAKKASPTDTDVESKANPKLDSFLTKIEQVRDFIETTVLPSVDVPETREKIESKLEQFVNELADAVSDADLLEKVNNYLAFASIFSYSFLNTFLIYIQNSNAREVLSKGDWRKLNMQPKSPDYLLKKYPGTGAIGLWVPVTTSAGSEAEIRAERDWRKDNRLKPLPEAPTSADIWYKKPIEKTGLNYYQKVSLDKTVRIAASKFKGYSQFKVRFNHLDVEDVEQIPTEPVVSRPEKPAWHTSEPDEKADHIYEILVRVIKGLGLNFSEESDEDLGGAKGMSSMGGDIQLLASNAGIGRASTAAHELGHALTHQNFLSQKYNVDQKLKRIAEKEARGEKLTFEDRLTSKEQIVRDAYRGRDARHILELQAEGIAFVVLRYFGIPSDKLKHSAAYISLWRNDNDAVKANLEIISATAKGIISLMKEEMDGNSANNNLEAQGGDELEEEENLSFLYEMSIIAMNRTINEMQGLRKLLT